MFEITQDMRPNHEFSFEVIKESLEKGIRIDVERIKSIIQSQSAIMSETLSDIQLDYEIENPNSPKQVKDALLKYIKEEDLNVCYSNGKISANKLTLKKLSDLGYEIADYISTYRKAKKVIESCSQLIECADENGLIHPNVERGITNRFNYSSPALMNIPKAILWDVIIPFSEDKKLYSVDIKQQEPWVLVNLLEIDELRELLLVHKDFYKALYFAAFGEECTEEQRAEVKRAWNAMSYGAMENSVVQYCTTFDGHKLYKYFHSIKEYKEYRGRAFGWAKKHIHRLRTYFNTVLYAAEEGSKLQRVLMNIPIQGTGSDILSFLIEHFYDEVGEYGYTDNMRIYYTRHDELIIEVSKGFTNESVRDFLKEVFTHQIDDWQPFEVEVNQVSLENLDEYDIEE